jgi:hypothetical protein
MFTPPTLLERSRLIAASNFTTIRDLSISKGADILQDRLALLTVALRTPIHASHGLS